MKETLPIRIHGKRLGAAHLPAIIAPLVGRTQVALLEEIAEIVPKQPDMLEWRIDFFESIGSVPAVVGAAQAIRRAANGIPVLLTRRSTAEGGQPLTVGEPAVMAMYEAACEARCVEMIDLELATAMADIQRIREVSRACGIGLILSFHDFQATPEAAVLYEKFALAARLGADVAKVAAMPQSDGDVLALLDATRRARDALGIPLISMSMGGLGAISRVSGWFFGSSATFAVGKRSSAPGQLSIEDMKTALEIARRAALGA